MINSIENIFLDNFDYKWIFYNKKYKKKFIRIIKGAQL